MLHTHHFNTFQFRSPHPLSNDQMSHLTRHLEAPRTPSANALAGRSQPVHIHLSGYGQVTLKKYYRGGIIRHIVKETHVKWGPTRPECELLLLIRLAKMGVNAPKPLAAITRGRFLYQAWLVMRKIEHTRSLADLASIDRETAQQTLPQLVEQVDILIKDRIWHTDLHPGNVLIDSSGKVYLVDFDKCRTGGVNRKKLIDHYNRRWRRAIMKYRLPMWLDLAIEK